MKCKKYVLTVQIVGWFNSWRVPVGNSFIHNIHLFVPKYKERNVIHIIRDISMTKAFNEKMFLYLLEQVCVLL